MTTTPGATTPARRRTPWLRPAIALIVVALLAGVWSAVRIAGEAVPLVGQGLSAPVLTSPEESTMTLEATEYAVLEGTGTAADGGTTTLTPSDVTLTGPDGAALTVRPTGGGTETFTRNGTVFTAFAYVTVPAAGEYLVAVAGSPGTQVIVSRSVSSGFRSVLPWIVTAAGAGILLVLGLVLLLVALVRRPRAASPVPVQTAPPATIPVNAPAGTPAPGWYPDPGRSGGQRWWDGARWTDQAR